MKEFMLACYVKWKKLPHWFSMSLLFAMIDALFLIVLLILNLSIFWEVLHLPFFMVLDPLCGLVLRIVPISGFTYDIIVGLLGVFILGMVVGTVKQLRRIRYLRATLVILIIVLPVLNLVFPFFYIRMMNVVCIMVPDFCAAGFMCIPFAAVLDGVSSALPVFRMEVENKMMTDMGRELFMGFLGHDKEATPILMKIAGDKAESEFIRDYAIHTLGLINDKRALDLLVVLLEDENKRLQLVSAGALSRISEIPEDVSSRAAPLLIRMLREDPTRSVIETLGHIRATSSVDYLISLLKDPEWLIRMDTAKALGEIKDQKAFVPLKEAFTIERHDWTKTEMAIAVAKFGDNESFEYLLNELKQPADCVDPKATIARGLGEIGNPAAIEPLLKEYELSKEEKSCIYDDIHVAIGRSLVMLGSPKGIPILERYLEGYDLYIMEIAQDTLDNKEKWLPK